MSEEIECIGICEADEAGTHCTGCGRAWEGDGGQQAEGEALPVPTDQEAGSPCS